MSTKKRIVCRICGHPPEGCGGHFDLKHSIRVNRFRADELRAESYRRVKTAIERGREAAYQRANHDPPVLEDA